MFPSEWRMQERELRISTDKHELDLSLIHRFLSQEACWSQGVPQEVVRRAIEHSQCFGAFIGDAQVGFARVISDRAPFAYLADVLVAPAQRARGVAKTMLR